MKLLFLKKAQALLELAIFGAFLLMLLGVLLSYGLTYYFQAKTKAEAFRNTLAGAANSNLTNHPSSVTSIYLRDKYIPEPANPFGMGFITPVTASASGLVRTSDLRLGPGNASELPQTQIFLDNLPPMNFSSSKFMVATSVTLGQIHKYQEIYGDVLCCKNKPCRDLYGGDWAPLYDSNGKINSVCIKSKASPERFHAIRYINSVDTQLMDYSSAVRQCRQLVDSEVCKQECIKGRTGTSSSDVSNCTSICDEDITSSLPWYCRNANLVDSVHRVYEFPNLNSIFAALPRKTKGFFGVQGDYERTTYSLGFLEMEANSTYLQAEDVFCFMSKTKKWVIFRPRYATTNQVTNITRWSNVSLAITTHERTPR
ncbi:MAG: hypothetical protein NC923_04510 [Candidatus Omnitrophica bacterium]|nr:hypothetical protein [Candidatus Omnitrophota bacterium]